MARRDCYDDRNAPKAISVVPSATVTIMNDDGVLLLIHMIDNNLWALPGGGHEAGESLLIDLPSHGLGVGLPVAGG